MADQRLSKLASHLISPSSATTMTSNGNQLQANSTASAASPKNSQAVESFLDDLDEAMRQLEDRTKQANLPAIIGGPLDDMTERQVRVELQKAFVSGQNMILVEKWTKKYGKNVVFPMTITPRGEMPYKGWLCKHRVKQIADQYTKILTHQNKNAVTIGDPDDATRILMNHAKKSDLYGLAFLGDGVLSTRDNDLWMEQRKHLQEAFLPQTALKIHVFPKSYERAKFAARTRLGETVGPNGGVLEINEFLLHEAMAQLQLALIGESQEDMDRTNIPLRRAHESSLKFQIEPFEEGLVRRKSTRKKILELSDDVLKRCPQGVLGQRLVDNCPFGKNDPKIQRDTVSTFNFAGYDTTGK